MTGSYFAGLDSETQVGNGYVRDESKEGSERGTGGRGGVEGQSAGWMDGKRTAELKSGTTDGEEAIIAVNRQRSRQMDQPRVSRAGRG